MQAFVGVLIFLFPLLSLVTHVGVGLSSFVFLIASLFFLKPGFAGLRRHWNDVRWVIVFFGFYFAFAFACFLLRGEPLRNVENPARMLFAVSALMLVLALKPDRRALWWGAIGGALGAMLLVGYQRLFLGLERPGGFMNAITFGDLALSLGLVALPGVIDVRRAREAVLPAAGVLMGLAASTMTGTRGGWLALALAAILSIQYSHILNSLRSRAIVAIAAALMIGAYLMPETGVRERVRQGVYDVTTYFDGGSAFSNVGIRLELWKAAGMLYDEAPLLGRTEAEYRKALADHVASGRLDPVVLAPDHFHNEALQALVTGGVAGFAAWFGVILAPFLFFRGALRATHATRQEFALALAGILTVTSYFAFGLTEVIFWSVKGSLFYALMVFLLMGLYLNARDARCGGSRAQRRAPV